jgi:glycosyltransferase involved in cell wall biosynthesis
VRIGITLQSLDATWGGIGIYTEEIVKHLLKLDKENEYVLMYPGFGAARKSFGQYRRYKNAKEVETQFSRVPSGWYWDQVVVPKVSREYGVDVLFNPFLSVPIMGRFKKVMIMHAVEYHTVPKVYDWKLYLKWSFLEKVLLPEADRLISISSTMTQELQRAVKYPKEKVCTVYHGVSDRFRVIQDAAKLREAKEEYELPDDFILFVGHLYPEKNFGNLVRALHLIAKKIPHDLIVVGRKRWKYQEDLELIDSLGLRDRVNFLYYIPNGDLPAIYNLASCFVLPSLYEGFGLVLLEAMACGCPVVASQTGAIPEISDGAAMLFDPHDPEEMGRGILKAVNDSEFRQYLVKRGITRAREFTWDRCALETLQVFKEVVSS